MDFNRGKDEPADFERIGRAFCRCEEMLKTLRLPSLRESMSTHVATYLEQDKYNEDVTDPLVDASVHDHFSHITRLVQHNPEKFKAIVDSSPPDAMVMQGAVTFHLLMNGVLADKKPSDSNQSTKKTESEAIPEAKTKPTTK